LDDNSRINIVQRNLLLSTIVPMLVTLSTFTSASNGFSETLSGSFSNGFILLGLVKSNARSQETFLRLGDTLLTSALITEGLKRTTLVERPDGTTRDSFPSGHATAAFATARFMSYQNPKDSTWWYAGAALISWSRVDLERHRWTDVLAGAAIGIATADQELKSKNGLLLRPFWSPSSSAVGLTMEFRF
jgi:membrane-associated phospholipid phosphatase